MDAGDFAEGGGGGLDQGFLVGLDGGEADVVDVVDGGGEGDAAFDVGCAGFVFEGCVVVAAVGVFDLFDHFTATTPWGQ